MLGHARRAAPASPGRVTRPANADLTQKRHRAAPSTARCRPRSFADANYLGLNLREA